MFKSKHELIYCVAETDEQPRLHKTQSITDARKSEMKNDNDNGSWGNGGHCGYHHSHRYHCPEQLKCTRDWHYNEEVCFRLVFRMGSQITDNADTADVDKNRYESGENGEKDDCCGNIHYWLKYLFFKKISEYIYWPFLGRRLSNIDFLPRI